MILLHVDVDNLWIYEQEFGISIYPNKEYIYSHSLSLFLKLLEKTRSKATFMIIGQDLKLRACQKFCRKAIAAGHEIANHTWSHPISFGALSYLEKKKEIVKTHEQIKNVCGKSPVGFRGAGYYQDKEIITILQKLGYQYDSSVLPGFAQIMMSAYAHFRGGENRHKTFGRPEYLLSKQEPHFIKGGPKQSLLELPISTLPILRLPIHTTFAYFFGTWYRQLILRYLKNKPSYLLYLFHVIDFVDLPKQNRNHPVIPLQYPFDERLNFLEKILHMLVQVNGGPLQTSRESLNTNFNSNPH